MRRLIYVPIIHTDLDLGSLAEGIEERSKAIAGASKWQQHKDVVRLYWQVIADYWQGKDVAGFKIFQDGMVAGGTIGQNIVQDLANKGSINHQIIAQLLTLGAVLMQTEDPELVKEEYFLTRELLAGKSFAGSLWTLSRYKWRKDRLLKERDAYIGKRINESLGEGETGVCFLGAYHEISSSLAKDIIMIRLKDPQKVRAYSQQFASKRWEEEVDKLADYLTTPINIDLGEGYGE